MLDSPDGVQTIIDPRDAAEFAGLRYISDARPGIRRKKAGTGFTYARADGSRLSEANALKRIKALAIPPPWADVWICPFADGHIQATGRDAKGRKQSHLAKNCVIAIELKSQAESELRNTVQRLKPEEAAVLAHKNSPRRLPDFKPYGSRYSSSFAKDFAASFMACTAALGPFQPIILSFLASSSSVAMKNFSSSS